MSTPLGQTQRLAVVVKGYPRLSETFIAQEVLALERRGFSIDIWALRRPTDGAVHTLNREIAAKPSYLPEYLYQEPLRVLRGLAAAARLPGIARVLRVFLRDLRRDFTANRVRRLGQACVLARELDPAIRHLHVHYLHTPCSVVRYAALLTGRSFSFSAHAKDIWTTPDWERREKLADAQWGVTCTRQGFDELVRVAEAHDGERLTLVYHGIDPLRMPQPPVLRAPRNGSVPADPVRLLSIGRLVAKKGFDTLMMAMASLPRSLSWRATIIGSGELKDELLRDAAELGIGERVELVGALAQDEVVSALRGSDLFVLACREGEKGDRDGLPNVILEAASQGLAILSTDYAAVPEFIENGRDGVLVPPDDGRVLGIALASLIRDPARRATLGRAARRRFETAFSFEDGVAVIAGKLAVSAAAAQSALAPAAADSAGAPPDGTAPETPAVAPSPEPALPGAEPQAAPAAGSLRR
jgi:glycosyltransferase involved in cell wall biosynthesis